MKTIPVTARVEPISLALIRDSLIAIGFPHENLSNNAQIFKTAVMFSLTQLKQMTNITTPSEESLALLERKPKLRK